MWRNAKYQRVAVNDDPDFGFKLTCKKCGGDKITFGNDLGFSAESGGWGCVDLKCETCGNETVLVEG